MTIPTQVRPSGFTDHAFDFSCTIDRPWGEVWDWLLEPDTFVKGQFWLFGSSSSTLRRRTDRWPEASTSGRSTPTTVRS